MTGYALKAPPHAWKVPGWATPHNLALIAAAAVVAVVVLGLVRAVGRLAKAAGTPAPAPSPKSSGKSPAFLVAAAAAAGGWLLWKRHGAAAAKAAPAPSPQPTVTVTAPPHGPAPHPVLPHLTFLGHLSGTEWTVIAVAALLVAYAIVRPLLSK